MLDIDIVVPVAGKHTTQARAVGQVGDKEIFTVNAALGSRSLDIAGRWAEMPEMPPPAECPPAPRFEGAEGTIHDQVEIRIASGRVRRDGTPSPDGRSALWIRLPVELERSAAGLAIVADWVPRASARRSAAGPEATASTIPSASSSRRRRIGSCATSTSTASPKGSATASSISGAKTAG